MAAVLCQGVGTACGSCCDCIGSVVTFPCKACGWCCDKFGRSCMECCAAIGTCCSTAFGCYVTTAVVFHIPSLLVGILDWANGSRMSCSASVWLLVHWLLCWIHIVAAFYMSYAVQQPDNDILPQTASRSTSSSGLDRIQQLFCYDVWMALYMVMCVGYIVWLCVGAVWYVTGQMGEECASAQTTAVYIPVAMGFGWAFLFFGGAALLASLCCTAWWGSPSSNHQHNPPTTNIAQQQQQQQQQQQNASTTHPSSKLPAAASATASTTTTTSPQPSAPEKSPPMASATTVGGGHDDDDNDHLPTATASPMYAATTGQEQEKEL